MICSFNILNQFQWMPLLTYLFFFVFCILFVNIDKTVVCTSVKSIKSLSLSLSLNLSIATGPWP